MANIGEQQLEPFIQTGKGYITKIRELVKQLPGSTELAELQDQSDEIRAGGARLMDSSWRVGDYFGLRPPEKHLHVLLQRGGSQGHFLAFRVSNFSYREIGR